MKLLLTSAGFTNKSIANALLDLSGRPFSDLKLVFIPTAANVEEGGKEWLIDDLYNCKKLGFKEIEIVDISAVPKEIWLKQFNEADILMFGGGNARYLIQWIRKLNLNELLPKLLKNKVYVGVSAGSMVVTDDLSLTSDAILYYDGTSKFKADKALNFVSFGIRPHFNSSFFPKIREEILQNMAKDNHGTFYAIDDQSAVKVDGEMIEVVSEGEWKKFN